MCIYVQTYSVTVSMFLWDETTCFPPLWPRFRCFSRYALSKNRKRYQLTESRFLCLFCVQFHEKTVWTWRKKGIFYMHSDNILIVAYILCKVIHGSSPLLLCIILACVMHVCLQAAMKSISVHLFVCIASNFLELLCVSTSLQPVTIRWTKKQNNNFCSNNEWNFNNAYDCFCSACCMAFVCFSFIPFIHAHLQERESEHTTFQMIRIIKKSNKHRCSRSCQYVWLIIKMQSKLYAFLSKHRTSSQFD